MKLDIAENARFFAISAQVSCFEKFHLGCIFRDEYEVE
jgi:hypothetical protein